MPRKWLLRLALAACLTFAAPSLTDANGALWEVPCLSIPSGELMGTFYVYSPQELGFAIIQCQIFGGRPFPHRL